MQLRHGMPWVKAGRGVACALTVLRKIDGKYLPTKRNGDACKTLCFKLVSELSVYTQKNLLDLRAMTQARGSFTLEFVRYEEVPKANQAKIIADAKAND